MRLKNDGNSNVGKDRSLSKSTDIHTEARIPRYSKRKGIDRGQDPLGFHNRVDRRPRHAKAFPLRLNGALGIQQRD